MTACDREELVLDVLRSGRALADTELAPHVAACAACTDLVAVASALLDEHHAVVHEAPVPTSGVVWWRMQRRMRAEALQTAARTVTVAQTLTVAGTLAVALAVFGAAVDWRAWLSSLTGALANISAYVAPATLPQWSIPLAFAVAACIALAPVAVYLSLARD